MTVANAARHFARGMVMPNLSPPVVNVDQASAYRQRILTARPADSRWQPLMSLYLTDNTAPDDVDRARDSGIVYGFKYYPAGATTNSAAGVTAIPNIHPVLERMQTLGLPLQLHGEVTDPEIDIFDREAVFIERVLGPLTRRFPALKVVFEHITTQDGAQFVAESNTPLAATITPQHLLFNRNDLLVGGIRPHRYCLPVLKRNTHQQALIAAATSGNPKFFLGTDSAPHTRGKKESACGCAGCYTHHAALELYAAAFEKAQRLDKLEGFASVFGADFYGLPRNSETVTLRRQAWQVPETLALGKEALVPLCAGDTLQWQTINE